MFHLNYQMCPATDKAQKAKLFKEQKEISNFEEKCKKELQAL
jgi:hypothetical protein